MFMSMISLKQSYFISILAYRLSNIHNLTDSMFHNGKSNKEYKSTLLPKGIVTNACLRFRVSKRNVKLNL